MRCDAGHTDALSANITSRIDWVPAELTSWAPTEEHFDLVCAHYLHPAASCEVLLRQLAASVAPGGTLLIVGHHPSDQQITIPHALALDVHFTAEEVAAGLELDRWDITVTEARSRSATDRDGKEITIRDAVFRARKSP